MRARALKAALVCLLTGSLSASLLVEQGASAVGPATISERSAAASQAVARPNILVIFTDDMRRDEMRFMPRTRRLIGRRGVVYRKGLSENPLCCPFRAALLTGQYSHNNGVLSNRGDEGGYLALDQEQTMNNTLQRSGYKTAYIGKFLNGYPEADPQIGWDYVPPGWDEWHVPVWDHYNYDAVTLNRNGRARRFTQHRADLLGRVGSAVIKRLALREEPFFAAVGFLAPHTGLAPGVGWGPPKPAPRHRGSLKNRLGPLPTAFNEADVSDKPEHVRSRPRLSTSARKRVVFRRRARAESLKSVDEAIARQLRALRRTGELSRTIVAFTSDNGMLLGEHRLMEQKRVPYEESIRVPMMIRGPGFPAGARDESLVGVVDLASTFAHAALIVEDLPYPLDGRDLRPKQGRSKLLETGAHLLEGLDTAVPRSYVGVRTDDFMYARYWTGEEELYDLRNDRQQLTSVHGDPHYAATLEHLRGETERLKDCVGTTCH